ncbi:hypothetical protein LTR49_026382 [Elasticomyces elasticus]|nr:hypothetical protein LTR49_026382 [Elasticomyces elasticus]
MGGSADKANEETAAKLKNIEAREEARSKKEEEAAAKLKDAEAREQPLDNEEKELAEKQKKVDSQTSDAIKTSLILTALAAVASTSSLPTVSSVPTRAASSLAASGAHATPSGTQFTIDGQTGCFAGTNTYWTGFLTNNDDIDTVMQHLQSSGLKILRVWGFNDVTSTPSSGTVYSQSFASSEPTINTGTNGLQRLDYAVNARDQLIINFVNNWTDYGGMAAYFSWAGISTNAQWYTSSKAQGQYRKYIEVVVSRYSDSSSIFAWRLANEPRFSGCDTSVMRDWVSTTAKYMKSLDSNHMVTIGDEGFGLSNGDDGSYPYSFSEGVDFAANCAVADIDFCTYHLYPDSWGVSPVQSWGSS